MGVKSRKTVLCDSNVYFEFANGNEAVLNELKRIGNDNIAFSIVTHAEAFCVNGKQDFEKAKKFLSLYPVFHINEEVSKIFNGLILAHRPRTRWIPDALIAATCIHNGLELYTLNAKDFDFIKELKLYKRRK